MSGVQCIRILIITTFLLFGCCVLTVVSVTSNKLLTYFPLHIFRIEFIMIMLCKLSLTKGIYSDVQCHTDRRFCIHMTHIDHTYNSYGAYTYCTCGALYGRMRGVTNFLHSVVFIPYIKVHTLPMVQAPLHNRKAAGTKTTCCS